MHKVQFYLGEQRHIRLQVHSKENLPFTIRNATWELQYLGKEEASGDCSVQDHILDVKIAPLQKTLYRLLIAYEVADERLMECVEVLVM